MASHGPFVDYWVWTVHDNWKIFWLHDRRISSDIKNILSELVCVEYVVTLHLK
jgi:hypothetical protein